MLALSTLVIAASSPTVQLDCGTQIRGYHLKTFDVDAFEGIKFAEARRFAPPEDLDCPDADVFDATAASDMCVQPMMLGMGVPYSTMGLVYFMLPVPVLLHHPPPTLISSNPSQQESRPCCGSVSTQTFCGHHRASRFGSL